MQSNKRTIRSFVRRSGRLTPSQQKAIDDMWPQYGIDYADAKLNFEQVFDTAGPVVLEIGFGNGETLVQHAAEDTASNFIGIEVHEPGIGHCLLCARNQDVANLRLIAHDAIDVLAQQIPDRSLSRVNLYFPDPWPKKRHHKRRIVQPDFLNLVADRLSDSGALHIATDWAAYAEHIDETLAESNRFSCAEKREHSGEHPLDRPSTKFEQRGLRKGHEIVDWRFEKSHI